MAAVTIAKKLDLRRQGIGGSDASAILGLNPWKTAMDVWLDKPGEFTEDEELDNEKMYWGTVLEDVVTREFMKRSGLRVWRKNAMLRHRSKPFMIANVDRSVAGVEAVLEVKTAGYFSEDAWEDGIPEYYIPQVQHYMAVTGFSVWHVAVLIGGQEFRHFRRPEIMTSSGIWFMQKPTSGRGCFDLLVNHFFVITDDGQACFCGRRDTRLVMVSGFAKTSK